MAAERSASSGDGEIPVTAASGGDDMVVAAELGF